MIKPTGCRLIVLRFFVIINFVSWTVLVHGTYPWSNVIPTKIAVCKEPECHERAKNLLESIDKDVDPCFDFYEYVCGKWRKKNPIPFYQFEWSVDSKLDVRAIREMSVLLKRDIFQSDNDKVKRAKTLYHMCNSLPSTPIGPAASLKSIIKEAGPWPLFHPKEKYRVSWYDVHDYYVSVAGDTGLFGISLRYDEEIDEILIKLNNIAHPCGLIQRLGEWSNETIYKYQAFLLMLARTVANENREPNDEDLLQDIADVIIFREKLEKSNPVTVEYAPLTIKYFTMWYNIKTTAQKGAKKIPWLEIFRKVLKNTGIEINEETKVEISSRQAFANLPRLLTTTPQHVIVNHLHLHFIEKHILLDDKLNAALSKVLIHNGKIMGTVVPRRDRSAACVLTHPLKETLGNMYVSTLFRKGTRDSALYYAKIIKNMIKMHISGSSWLDDSTKVMLLTKLANIDVYMGYRDNRKAESVEQKDIKMTPYRAMSFYSPKENSIFISAGYFRPPVYGNQVPSAVNYGTISTFIAYEMYQALTGQHVHKHPMNSTGKCRYCWSDEMLKEFDTKSTCFKDMYTDLTDKELDKIKPTPKSNGAQTLLKNMAEVMALRTTMEAFKKLLWEANGKCRILPHFKDLTCQKLFFLSYASTFCSVSPTWSLLKQMQLGIHSTPRLRVNVPLSSMEEFREAFQCPANSPMVSEKRCWLCLPLQKSPGVVMMRNYLRPRIRYIYVISLIISKVFVKGENRPWDTISNIKYEICTDFKCFERAQYVENSVDKSIDPCKDFYQYACGKWIKNHPVPQTEVEYSIETYLKRIAVLRVQQLLEQHNFPNDTANVKAARKVYRECMKKPDLGRVDARVLRFHMNKVGFWPMCSSSGHDLTSSKSWIKIFKYYLTISRDSSLFDMVITINEKKEPIIQIEELTSPFVMLDVIRWSKVKEEHYTRFLKSLIKSLKIFLFPECKVIERVQEVIHFRKQLDELIKETSLKKQEHIEHIETTTIQKFQEWYNNKVSNLRSRSFIPWLEILRTAFPTVNGQEIDGNTQLNVANKEYFDLLAGLIDQTPYRVIVNHIQLYFAERHLKLDSKLKKLLHEIILKDDTFYDDILMNIDAIYICILEHPMQVTIANMYNEAYLTQDIETDFYALVGDVKEMLKVQMLQSKWLHTKMKFTLAEKLSRTQAFIGVRDVIDNKWKRPWLHDKKKLAIRMTPSFIPDASYTLTNEYVLIGTGYLQDPIYDLRVPYAMNYGSLGSLLGHEFFHSFQTSLSSKYNKFLKNGDNETTNLYEQKTSCFVEHYKQFDVKDLNDLPASYYVKPDPVQTLEENIADTMGMKAAYDGYRRKLWQNRSVCQTPLFDLSFSCDQLFFISFALTFCGNIPSTEIRKMLKRLDHLPPRIRLNNTIMSCQKGNANRSRPQKYKNHTAFKNDLHDTSHKTKFINNIEVANVCERCKKIIEWKIKYKKYKPLKAPAKCTKCEQKNVKHAYHIMCLPCAKQHQVCPKCGEKRDIIEGKPSREESVKLDVELQALLKKLPERKRRTFVRYMNRKCDTKKTNSEITTDEKENSEAGDVDEENEKSTEALTLKKEDLLEKLKALVLKEGKDDDFNDDFDDDSEDDLDSM
ncbi:hypothetical protein KPH14_005488 [Odynerus spinipes]|uniref:Uncharacterized protein n=1 Tax=Odynerus spinipes TaxID=1348599 RepID=A0AAD9VJC2_9HYME|nr:hypothetical protein KPH14_005488 [Odynerus spinipes]